MAGSTDTSLRDALVELSFLIQATLARLAGEHEVTLAQVRLLGILRDREPGIVELAEALGLDKSSVSGLVDRAQRRGLVRRASANGADGRAIRVLLTPAGRTLAEGFAERVAKEVEKLVEGISPAQRERLAATATRIVADSGMAAGLEAPHALSVPDRTGRSRLIP